MTDISKMIEEAVRKAVRSQGAHQEDKHQVGNGNGGSQDQEKQTHKLELPCHLSW